MHSPGHSIRPVDAIGRGRMIPGIVRFRSKKDRIRPGWRRNLCGRIPDRITTEKIWSVSVISDYRILSETTGSVYWKESDNTEFLHGSRRILSESGNPDPTRIIPIPCWVYPYTYTLLGTLLYLYSNGYIHMPIPCWVYPYTYTVLGTLLYLYPDGYIHIPIP